MILNVSGLPKFGNLVKGGGLASVFDGNIATVAYAESSGGFAGVDARTNPIKVGLVDIVAWANGYDGSGLTTPITLTLRGMNGGGVPAKDDGIVLDTISFTDVNSQVTKTLTSSDQTTLWDYVWVTVSTGLWSQYSEIRIYAPEQEPIPSEKAVTVYQKGCHTKVSLKQKNQLVPEFCFSIAVDEESVAAYSFVVNISHVGHTFSPQYLGAVGVGANLVFKHCTSFVGLASSPWCKPPLSHTNGTNVEEPNPAHYTNVMMEGSMPLVPGFYTFGLEMTAHTDGDNRDGLAQVWVEKGVGLNGLRVVVFKGAEFHDMSN